MLFNYPLVFYYAINRMFYLTVVVHLFGTWKTSVLEMLDKCLNNDG